MADGMPRQPSPILTAPGDEADSRFSRLRRVGAAGLAAAGGLATLAGQLSARVPSALAHQPAAGDAAVLALHALGFAGGLGLLVLAHGLWRGKRRAVYIAAGALCLIAAERVAFGLGPLDAGVDLALAALLVANRGAFLRGQAPAERAVAISGTVALAAAAGLYATYALIVLAVAHKTDTDQVIALAGRGLLAGAWWAGTNWWVRLILDALIATTIVAGAAFLYGLLRPAPRSEGHPPDEHARARLILREHGADSLDPFALREDKAFHFAGGGFLAYRVLRETAVVSGEPIGPSGAAPLTLASFMRYAREHGWDVVVTGASDRHLADARALGLHALRIGEEAVVDPSGFSLEGRAIRKVRQSIARVERRGWRIETVEGPDVTPELVTEVQHVESAWRASQRRLIGFAMTLGRLAGTDEDEGALYVLARDPEERLRSFLRFAAYRDGLSLDLMRRLGDEPNGLTEAQVVAAIEHARARGMRGVSLNFAGFAHVMAADAALSRSQRLLRRALRTAHGRFQFERLSQFNAKFFPSWQPRYLLYSRLTHLPLAALRVLQAEAYLPGPSGPRMPGRWEAHPLPGATAGTPTTGAYAWRRWAMAALILLAALAVPTELLVRRAVANAKPLRILANLERSKWSFTYAGRSGDSTSSTLYLPDGRPVTLRFAGGPPRSSVRAKSPGQPSQPGRTVHVPASRPGVLPVPCAAAYRSGRCVIKADVLQPGGFWTRLAQHHAAPSRDIPQAEPEGAPHAA